MHSGSIHHIHSNAVHRGIVVLANFRIIGDVHGHYKQYHLLLRKAQSTVQVGDFGFKYTTLLGVDARRHRILGGNHDNYDEVEKWPHFLGDYGVYSIPEFGDLFFVRGGVSIDRHLRTEGVNWWAEEELSMAECYAALAEYSKIKPNWVITHECPRSIVPYITESSLIIPSRTNQLLEQMFVTHQPNRWVFGHYHKSWNKVINGTHFTCLKELECLDF